MSAFSHLIKTNNISNAVKNNLTASVAPTVNDDADDGYSVSSLWIDLVADEAYRCVDATVGSAVWISTTLEASELATVAVTGDSDDLIEGSVKLLLTTTERSNIATNNAKVSANAVSVASIIDSADAKTTPVDADLVGIVDSEASSVLKKLSWANIKATLNALYTGKAMTTQGDVLYGAGSGIATRLAKGTASQVLAMNTGATAPEWVTPSGGGDAGSWVLLKEVTADGTSLVLDTGIFAEKRNLRIEIDASVVPVDNYLLYGGDVTFNDDSGNNYGWKITDGVDSSEVPNIHCFPNSYEEYMTVQSIIKINNNTTTKPKQGFFTSTAGANDGFPYFQESYYGGFVWGNVTEKITSVQITNSQGGTEYIASGSTIKVYGSD